MYTPRWSISREGSDIGGCQRRDFANNADDPEMAEMLWDEVNAAAYASVGGCV
jgi:hypothetical protein